MHLQKVLIYFPSFYIIFILGCCIDMGCCLRISQLVVPTVMVVGEDAWLQCHYIQENDNIYGLKWYLGLDEFYRWTPAESPSVKAFPIRGNPLVVDKSASHRGQVRIMNVTLGATGVFRCEVSAEAPSFHTVSDVATMMVVDVPDDGPLISGVQDVYNFYDDVKINCTSPPSKPAPTLTFYINDQLADPSWVKEYSIVDNDNNTGLQTNALGLAFPLIPMLLQSGPTQIKCTSAIYDRYWQSSMVILNTHIPYQASRVEQLDFTIHTSNTGVIQTALPMFCALMVLAVLILQSSHSVS